LNVLSARDRARLCGVLAHLEQHLDAAPSLAQLAAIAHWSPHHFHRRFSAAMGVPLAEYLRWRRMHRAAFRLAFRHQNVLEVALEAGYAGPEAFARAFRQVFGVAPTAFRAQPRWQPWLDVYPLLNERSSRLMTDHHDSTPHVRIIDFPRTPVALLVHRGDARALGTSLRRFIDWRRQHRLSPAVSATYNLLYDDPGRTAPQDCRIGLCAALPPTGMPEALPGIMAYAIPGGRCAVLRRVGADHGLRATIVDLLENWLPGSGERLRDDCPLFLQRVRFFPDVAEHEAVNDIFVPLT